MKSPNLDATLEGLAHLICGEVHFDPQAKLDAAQESWHKIPSARFDGFELFHPDMEDGEDLILLGSNPADQPVWPMDVCVGAPCGDDGEWPDGSWAFTRVRTLPLKEWRGRLISMMPRMVEVSSLISSPNGKQVSVKFPYGLTKQQAVALKVQISGQSIAGYGDFYYGTVPSEFGHRPRDNESEASGQIRAAAGLSLRRQYLWSVLIGEGDGPRARFVTDPIGAREAFRLRDIPPGASRRKALLHWVRSHWRKRRELTVSDRAWINEYLRGQSSYVWNGLRCEIEVSRDDLARLGGAKTSAAKVVGKRRA